MTEHSPAPDQGNRLFDPGLQPERTALAWRRTGLALTAAALVAMRIMPEALGAWAVLPAGLGLTASVWVLISAHRRHVKAHRTLVGSNTESVPLPAGALPFTIAMLVVAGGVAAGATVLATMHVR